MTKEEKKEVLKKRVYAFYIDFFLLFIISFTFILIVQQTVETLLFSAPISQINFSTKTIFVFGTYINALFTFAYFSLTPYFFDGQTFGKYVLNLKLVKIDGELNLYHYSTRALIYTVGLNLFPLIFLVSFMTKNTAGIFELIFKSKVMIIDENSQLKTDNVLYLSNSSESIDTVYFEDNKIA